MNIENLLAQITGQRHESALESQLRELRRDIRRVSQSVAHRAGHVANQASHTADDWSHDLSDLGREAARRGAQFAEVAAYQAGKGAKALRSDPLPAIAILGTAFLVARLFSRR